MLQSQPFFIAGIEDSEFAGANAFGAMGCFLFCFVASMVGMWYDSQYKVEPMQGGDETDYHLAQGDVPTYGTTN